MSQLGDVGVMVTACVEGVESMELAASQARRCSRRVACAHAGLAFSHKEGCPHAITPPDHSFPALTTSVVCSYGSCAYQCTRRL